MESRRLFAGVAVEASTALREMAAALRGGLRGERIRWVRPENWHLTLEFFGETEEGRRGGLEEALGKGVAGVEEFTMKIGGLGAFGGARHPRVVWLGVESEGLRRLRERMAAPLREAGWEMEGRAYRPHLTLGRMSGVRDAGRWRGVLEGVSRGPAREQVVREVVLFESAGGRHVALTRWRLGGA